MKKRIDVELTFDGNSNAIWGFGEGFIKVYTEDSAVKNKLLKLEGAQLASVYILETKTAWDFILPIGQLKTAKKLLK